MVNITYVQTFVVFFLDPPLTLTKIFYKNAIFMQRQPLIEEIFTGKEPSMEENLRYKRIFDGRRPSMQWRKTFNAMEGYLPCNGRRPSMEDDF